MPSINPVQYNIPTSYDYKNVNLKNFKGINCSENIFDNDTSSCQDCQNLYVNENNILAVRPRLHHEASFVNVEEVIKAESTAYDEMVYLVRTESGLLNIIISDKSTAGKQENDTVITFEQHEENGDVSTSEISELGECSFFRTGDGRLLCTSENGLFLIDTENRILREITQEDVYVPTTRVNMTFGDPSSGEMTSESPNLLSDREHRQYPISWKEQTILKQHLPETYDVSEMISKKDDDITISRFEDNDSIYLKKRLSRQNYDGSVSTYEERWNWDGNIDCLYGRTTLSNKKVAKITERSAYTTQNTILIENGKDFYANIEVTSACFEEIRNNSESWHMFIPGKLEINENEFVLQDITGDDVYWLSTNLSETFYNNLSEDDKISVLLKNVDNNLIWCVSITTTNKKLLSISWIDKSKIYNDNMWISFENHIEFDVSTMLEDNRYVLSDITQGFTTNSLLLLFKNDDDSNKQSFSILQWDNTLETINTFGNSILTTYSNSKKPRFRFYRASENIINIFAYLYDDDFKKTLTNKIYSGVSTYWSFDQLENIDEIQDDSVEDAYISRLGNTSWSILSKFEDNENVNQNLVTNLSRNSAKIYVGKESIFSSDGYIPIINQEYDSSLNTVRTTVVDYNTEEYELSSWLITLKTENPHLIEILYTNSDYKHDFSKVKLFDNKYFFYGCKNENNKNLIRWSFNTKLLYIPENNYANVGRNEDITNLMQLNTQQLGVFKKNETNILVGDENDLYWVYTLKTPKGCIGQDQATIIPTTNIPVVITDDSVCIVQQGSNNVLEDAVFTNISSDIFEKFSIIPNKESIKTHTHGDYLYFYYIDGTHTVVWVLDCRTNSWFVWDLPVAVINMYESESTLSNASETETRVVTEKDEYVLTTAIEEFDDGDDGIGSEKIVTYQDNLGGGTYRRIPWVWKSRILTLGTSNYLKKLTNLQLIFSDKARKLYYNNKTNELIDNQFTKNNSMFYEIKTYRKKSKFLNGSFVGELDGVGTQRIKLRLPKCDFAELTLSNYNDTTNKLGVQGITMFGNGTEMFIKTDDVEDPFIVTDYQSIQNAIDRLHLIGITFKVLLSEGIN